MYILSKCDNMVIFTVFLDLLCFTVISVITVISIV